MPVNANYAFYCTLDSLRPYTDDLQILTNQNPVEIVMNRTKYSIHVSVIHGSGNSRANDDELRIQVSRGAIKLQSDRSAAGYTSLFIGFFADGLAFTAWEPAYVFSQKNVNRGSVYARNSHEALVARKGYALRAVDAQNLQRPTSTLALPSQLLGFYLENWASLHEAQTEKELRLAIKVASQPQPTPGNGSEVLEELVKLGGVRKRITVTRTAYARNPAFTRSVLAAYQNSCCVCGRQMGLVQAAHIIPHGHPDSVDHVANGLALCVEHHKLYDDGLLLPTEGQRLFLNADRVQYLRVIKQDSGMDMLEAIVAKKYKRPKGKLNYPNEEFLGRGVRIRLGTDRPAG